MSRSLGRALAGLGWILLASAGTARGQGYPLQSASGTAAYDAFGFSVAGPGDVDQDGVPDFLVGIPGADPAGNADAGEARVISVASGAAILILPGGAAGDYFGYSVAGAGDLDLDGVPDLVVGASQNGSGGPGLAKVFSGASGAVLLTRTGTLAGDRFGASVAGAGDVNADGVADILVGAPRVWPGALPGYAKVYSGSTGATLLLLNGPGPGDLHGFAVAGAGDVNGDGRADLLIGAPNGPGSGGISGEARLLSGLDGTLIRLFADLGTYGDLGLSVGNAGLVNGDAVPDQILGSMSGAGVYSGVGGYTILAEYGGTGDWFGRSVAGAGGDVDGDGFGDLLVGAPASPIYSMLPGYARVVPGGPAGTAVKLAGSAPGDEFGWSAAVVGDVNDDGVPDFVVGAPGADSPGAPGAGSATVTSAVGIPPGSALLGSGCPGPGGLVPAITTIGGYPTTGFPGTGLANPYFTILLSHAEPGRPAFLFVGVSAASWMGTPLPFNLGPFGMPACFLNVQPGFIVPRTTVGLGPGGGKARVPMPIPAIPSLAGSHVYCQWYVVDPGPGIVPGAMSPGWDGVIL
ncbi:MAG TPA: integrin alpha [Planctomycetota bacterium]|nr:integrin alpha [Planctomycetota bacterium]